MKSIAGLARIRVRLALAITVTALIPLLAAIWQVERTVRTTSERVFFPDIGAHLERSLGLYQELARSVKALMREEATEIAAQGELLEAARKDDAPGLEAVLRRSFGAHPNLVSLLVRSNDERVLGEVRRDHPLDPSRENQLEVVRPLRVSGPEALELVAVFAADKARFEELSEMNQFVDTYRQVEKRRAADDAGRVRAFTVLLGLTILLAIAVGSFLARSVSVRIAALSDATRLVAEGDLNVRVPEEGGDEIADLARAFNRMLSEVADSRSRIEYLQRIGAWQEMARRLAHEIKNPLTPIQLAIQEVHRRYPGGDPEFKRLVDSTLEIVEDEVGTLRRLVGEFSNFARLPQAALEPADLGDFLREQQSRFGLREGDRDSGDSLDELLSLGRSGALVVEFSIPDGPCEALLDRQMLRRMLINLIRNAAQAVLDHGPEQARIAVRLSRHGDFWHLDVDDNGPGIREELRETVFDPYVTTKGDGTGLGLSIVKKIVIEHGGTIRAEHSELGGARLSVRLPVLGTRASARALEETPLSVRSGGGEARPGAA